MSVSHSPTQFNYSILHRFYQLSQAASVSILDGLIMPESHDDIPIMIEVI